MQMRPACKTSGARLSTRVDILNVPCVIYHLLWVTKGMPNSLASSRTLRRMDNLASASPML
eukprot:7694631-Pyramimonas_sp.AAC.1